MNLLITGAASGIGRAAADYFIKRGHTVFGIDIMPADERDNYCGFTADITDEASLLRVQRYFCENGIELDAILNIAGKHIMASLVEDDFSAMKRTVEINLLGAMLTNRLFHRFLKPCGRILIVTSEVAGFDPMPFNGLYSATKTALDSYAQALRQELNLVGKKVITIRPGAVETSLCSGSVKATSDLADTTVLYKKQAKRFSSIAARFMGRPMAADALAKLIYKAVTAKHPRFIYHKHRNAGLVLLNLLPKRLQCAV
ncbi:MAG: SDR family NAD(P)-dependent oxidoreductase, partial [Clostridia bacterium]|nr:SDR family NAD(P)-dependent oxidoreductase [Clostridia bacterium]